jgi:hypothetical protein
MQYNQKLSRRSFIKKSSAGAAATVIGSTLAVKSSAQAFPATNLYPGKVIEVVDPNMTVPGIGVISQDLDDRVLAMFDRGIMELTGQSTVQAAMETIFPEANKNVSLKVSQITANIPTRKEVVKACVRRLVDYRTTGDRIVVWDQRVFQDGVQRANYDNYYGNTYYGTTGVRCIVEYKDTQETEPVRHGDDAIVDKNGTEMQYSAPLFDCDYLVNVPVAKHHADILGGISMALKSHMGTIPCRGGQYCEDIESIVAFNNSKPVKDKTRLVLMSALHANAYSPWPWAVDCEPKAIFLSTDSVANDFVGRMRMNEEIVNAGNPVSQKPTSGTLIELAAAAGLGIASADDFTTIDMSMPVHARNTGTQNILCENLKASPNPFHSHAIITTGIRSAGNEKLEIFDVRGKLVNKLKISLSGTALWYGTDKNNRRVAPGRYIGRLKSGNARRFVKLDFVG